MGVPIINAHKMVACIDLEALNASADGVPVVFPTGATIGDEDEREAINLSVSPVCASVDDGDSTPCPELFFVWQGVRLARGHSVSFITASNCVLWSGYWNISKPCMNNSCTGANALQNAWDAVKFPRKRWGGWAAVSVEAAVSVVQEKSVKKAKKGSVHHD